MELSLRKQAVLKAIIKAYIEDQTDDVEKTIILVEGTSDKDILEFSLEQLYPHLYDLFYFMDFNDENGGARDGGTSYLIKNLKTFYFSPYSSLMTLLINL